MKQTTAQRLKYIMNLKGLRQVDILRKCAPYCEQHNVRLEKNDLSQYVAGKILPKQDKLTVLALALNVSEAWLMGYDVPMDRNAPAFNGAMPKVTDDIVSYPVIGEIAAGYDHTAFENFDTDETVEFPVSFLKGHPRSDFFVLKVIGDSMYPHYMEGDRVLIKKQSYVDRSGDIGAILYDGDQATIKKLEFVQGEDWLKLVPINPNFQPRMIKGPDLEQCRV
ncbi:MAG: hypothetical protein IJN42_01895, partial [Clostridia bacterium]|nr:hypothetical protein [Clostridia bacterium]